MNLVIYSQSKSYFAFPLSLHKFGYEKQYITEQGGIRPVLVIQNDTGNKYSPTIIVAAITSSLEKSKLPTHVQVEGKGLSKSSVALLEQIRTIDKCRISDYIGRLDSKTMNRIDRAIETSLEVGRLEVLRNG